MRVTVDWRGLQCQLPNLKKCVSKIDSLLPEIQAVGRGLSASAGSTTQIKVQLYKTSAQVSACRDSLFQMQSAAEKIASEYCSCEQHLSKTESTDQNAAGSNWKTAVSLIGSFGFAGKVADSIYGLSMGGTTRWKSVAKIVETGAKTIQRMADGKVVDIFGTLAVGKKIDALGNFVYESPSLSKELGKYVYDPSKCSTVAAKRASKIAVGAAWASLALSGIQNFNDNFKEFDGDLNSKRMYEETIVETAIDVGKGAAIGVLGALAVGASAPVWAAGVAAVGITSVCDVAVEWVDMAFGIDVKETVSDFAVDTYEFVRDTAKKTVKATAKFVGKAVSQTADCISAGWKKFISWF